MKKKVMVLILIGVVIIVQAFMVAAPMVLGFGHTFGDSGMSGSITGEATLLDQYGNVVGSPNLVVGAAVGENGEPVAYFDFVAKFDVNGIDINWGSLIVKVDTSLVLIRGYGSVEEEQVAVTRDTQSFATQTAVIAETVEISNAIGTSFMDLRDGESIRCEYRLALVASADTIYAESINASASIATNFVLYWDAPTLAITVDTASTSGTSTAPDAVDPDLDWDDPIVVADYGITTTPGSVVGGNALLMPLVLVGFACILLAARFARPDKFPV